MDGVLVDTVDLQLRALTSAIEKTTGVSIDTPENQSVLNSAETSVDKLTQLASRGCFPHAKVEAIYKKKKEITDQILLKVNPETYKEKVEVFKYLKGLGKKVSIVTNANRFSTQKFLKHLGLLEHLDLLITNNDVVKSKPHAEPYVRALIHLGEPIEKTIIFEDSEVGIISAASTGCRVVKITSPFQINLDFIKEINGEKC